MRLFERTWFIVLITAAACMQPAAGSGPADSAGQKDWSVVTDLENQAKAIAKTAGCATTAQCRAAPVGNRACGGPRYYLPYCAATTDSVALFRKLNEVKAAEDAYNRKYNIASTCEFRMPPTVTAVAGVCAAQ